MNCAHCGAELPADARFCIECGAETGAAATGATVKIDTADYEVRCGRCGTANPRGAVFCVNCGQRLVPDIGADPDDGNRQHPAPATLPPVESAPAAKKRRWRRSNDGFAGGLFLIGLALLFLTGTFWPGILVLVGLSGLLASVGRGDLRDGISGFVFMAGLAFIFAVDLFWPGILVVVGLAAIARTLVRR